MKNQTRQWTGRGRAESVLSHLYLIASFCILDFWLRIMIHEIDAYSIKAIEPNLFTLLWSVFLTALVTSFSSRKKERIVYGALYMTALVYAVVQYGAYLILGKLLFFSDFFYAGEGNDYIGYALSFITPAIILQVLLLCAIGIAGIRICPKVIKRTGRSTMAHAAVMGLAMIGIMLVPGLYENRAEESAWNTFDDPANEYSRFVNANFDMQLTGMYQYVIRDMGTQIERRLGADPSDVAVIDDFFADKPEHAENPMTGVFGGKNLLIVMMESVDDWLIDEKNTPTLYKMMSEGINLTNMYTPQYSNGYTFNTEFAFNTSVYPYTNGNVAYDLVRSRMDHTMANAFRRAGYRTNSFHMGEASFYNRGVMHQAFGYERYYSYQEFEALSLDMYDDRYLLENKALYELVMPEENFCSFVISYSGHLPYADEEDFSRYALEMYPQYDVQENRMVNILRAKIRLTDDMFAGLLKRLQEEGRLEDTVIVGFTDHYAYGLTDKELLQKLTKDAGCSILERTPAFIYCAGYDQPMTVDKVMQTTDLAPTIMNLFGLDVPKEIMGQDVFDDQYAGYAVFPGNTWLTHGTYMKEGTLEWNGGMTDEEIAQMNAYVQKVYETNDLILDTDYYSTYAGNRE